MKTHRLKYAQMMRKRDLYLRPQTTIVQVAYLCYSFVRIFGDSIFGFFNKLTPFTSSFLLFIYCCSFEMWHALNSSLLRACNELLFHCISLSQSFSFSSFNVLFSLAVLKLFLNSGFLIVYWSLSLLILRFFTYSSSLLQFSSRCTLRC